MTSRSPSCKQRIVPHMSDLVCRDHRAVLGVCVQQLWQRVRQRNLALLCCREGRCNVHQHHSYGLGIRERRSFKASGDQSQHDQGKAGVMSNVIHLYRRHRHTDAVLLHVAMTRYLACILLSSGSPQVILISQIDLHKIWRWKSTFVGRSRPDEMSL